MNAVKQEALIPAVTGAAFGFDRAQTEGTGKPAGVCHNRIIEKRRCHTS